MIRRSPPNPPSHTSGGQLNSGRGSLTTAPASFPRTSREALSYVPDGRADELQAARLQWVSASQDLARARCELSSERRTNQVKNWIIGIQSLALTGAIGVILWLVVR